MNFKVLLLDYWMQQEHMLQDCINFSHARYLPTVSRFNREGIYLEGDKCWFELADGRAYTYPASTFKYKLESIDILRLNTRQVLALETIVKQKLATRKQQHMLSMYNNSMATRATGRSARMQVRRVLNKRREKY